MPGPAPKPTALKIIKGNPGKRPLPINEPKPRVCAPRPPLDLSKEEKKHFRKIAKQLAELKVMTALDADALSMYCVAHARWKRANDELLLDGYVVTNSMGQDTRSPWIIISEKAFDQMKGILTEFGMTPSSRSKVQVIGGQDKEADPWNKV